MSRRRRNARRGAPDIAPRPRALRSGAARSRSRRPRAAASCRDEQDTKRSALSMARPVTATIMSLEAPDLGAGGRERRSASGTSAGKDKRSTAWASSCVKALVRRQARGEPKAEPQVAAGSRARMPEVRSSTRPTSSCRAALAKIAIVGDEPLRPGRAQLRHYPVDVQQKAVDARSVPCRRQMEQSIAVKVIPLQLATSVDGLALQGADKHAMQRANLLVTDSGQQI